MSDFGTTIRERNDHCISRRDIDPDALRVLYRLKDLGFVAYLVGGSVRDLLLGRKPKDFDVGTDAHPNQIKKAFRNCFLIGRRFRLAHIRFGSKVIETSTFRTKPETEADPEDPDASLFHRRDNTFGTPEEDARRRDFTVNGLFYDIRTFSVIDHVGGLADLDQRLIRSIGDPEVRFREDPVRMIRAVRFASRLGFRVEKETWEAILRHHREIEKCSRARLLEEIYRLFPYKSGEAAFRMLRETGLLSVLFPEINAYLNRNEGDDLLWRCLVALSGIIAAEGNPPAPLVFGTLYYPLVVEKAQDDRRSGRKASYALAAQEVIRPILTRYQISKRVLLHLMDMFGDQRRLSDLGGSPDRLAGMMAGSFFEDSLLIYEMYLTATGGDLSRIRELRRTYENKRHETRHGPRRHGAPFHPGAPHRHPVRPLGRRRRIRHHAATEHPAARHGGAFHPQAGQ